jgi:hypothetical protein
MTHEPKSMSHKNHPEQGGKQGKEDLGKPTGDALDDDVIGDFQRDDQVQLVVQFLGQEVVQMERLGAGPREPIQDPILANRR